MNTFGEYPFQVRSYECGPDGFATLVTVCNYLQEAASLHAASLGFSRTDFEAAGTNITWVLTKLRVKMNRYPAFGEKVAVGTCPRGGRRITAQRDFELRVGDELVGVAASEWMVIDLSSRKILSVPTNVYAFANDERPRPLGAEPFSKLRWDCREAVAASRFRARRGDIDLNGHVNNARYVEWVVETLPCVSTSVGDFEIVFKSETLAGDEVLAESVEVEPGVYAAHVAAPDAHEHVISRVHLL